MIIDAHAHLSDSKLLYGKAEDLIMSMKKAGIDRTFVFAGEINNYPTVKLLKELKKYKGILYPIGSVSPFKKPKPTPVTIESWLKRDEIFGLKFYSGYEHFYPQDDILRPYLKMLVKYNRPAIFHCGTTYGKFPAAKLVYAHPLNIDQLAVEMPDLKIIISHLGFPWVKDTASVVAKNKNVFTDCSGLIDGKFDQENEQFVIKTVSEYYDNSEDFLKVLFGSDWPITDQKEYLSVIRQTVIKEDDFAFADLAKNIFRI